MNHFNRLMKIDEFSELKTIKTTNSCAKFGRLSLGYLKIEHPNLFSNRSMLHRFMVGAGFVNFKTEWWHYILHAAQFVREKYS